jgi:Photosynthetic reaction centre cytochrome C subunit
MQKIKTIAGGIFLFVILQTCSALKIDSSLNKNQPVDSLVNERAKYVNIVRDMIKGKEKSTADSVFKNIQILKGVPAGALISIMDIAYSQSLGVGCGHCHNTNKWDSDEKPQKQVAREMSILLSKTKELIKGVKGLKSENPTINCTTCHRGFIKPALDLGE